MKNELIRQLEKLTNSQVRLAEGEIDLPMKKRFYGVSADFQKDLKRLVNFYEINAKTYPELKHLLKRVKRLEAAFEGIFATTEEFIDSGKESIQEVELRKEVAVGDNAQVYNKGEAFVGPLVAYGQVKGKEGNDHKYRISFDAYVPILDPYDLAKPGDDTENPRIWYSSEDYDIVRIDLEEMSFEKRYPKKKITEVEPIEKEPSNTMTKDAKPLPAQEPKEQDPVEVPSQNTEQPTEPTLKSDPKAFNLVAQETKDYITIIQKYVQPDTKDVASARKKIYDEFLNILRRYDKDLPLDTTQTSIDTLQELNAELKSFIDVYEIPTS